MKTWAERQGFVYRNQSAAGVHNAKHSPKSGSLFVVNSALFIIAGGDTAESDVSDGSAMRRGVAVCVDGNAYRVENNKFNPAASSSDAWDVAYDLWFNHASFTSTRPDGVELMI